MAKKAKTTKKPAVKKKAPAKKAGKARKPGPRSQTLPGMEAVRSSALDRICEGIGTERDAMNTAKAEEQSLISSALQVMQKSGITVYRHAKIELSRVPGAEKLRVRVTKEHGDAGADDLEQPEPDAPPF